MAQILVVDDDLTNIELLNAYLSADYEVISAQSGKEAIEKVQNESPDIILLDVMMPDMDGYEVCRILKTNPDTQFIPIIMVTALTQREERIKGIEVGTDEFLSKPVNRIELITRVKSLLHTKQLHDSLVSERNILDMQNRIRSVLTAIIPMLLKPLTPDHKNIIIHQMTDMVEKTILEIYPFDIEKPDLNYTGNICCNIMNQLGGSFTNIQSKEGKGCTIKGSICPWSVEEARRNPILCNLTRGIFSRIAAKVQGEVKVLRTIGNGNDCCLFEIYIK